MDNFKILEETGLKEVSDKTHIEVKYLEYMINSEFDKLSKSTTVGFVKILSREYKLDLTDWLNDAQKFWNENRTNGDTTKIFVVEKKSKILKYLPTIFFVLVLALILYGAYIFLNKKLDFFENPLPKSDTNYTYEETPVVNEAKVTLEENMTQNKKNMTQNKKNMTQNEENATALTEESESDLVESNLTNEAVETNNSIVETTKDTNSSIIEKKEIIKPIVKNEDDCIIPGAKLWLGVIYLDNFKRKSFLGKDKFALDISRDQLIATGHGNFTLKISGETKKFHSQGPVKLLIRDGEASVISSERFKELNKGSIW